jgi:hypothetical protein
LNYDTVEKGGGCQAVRANGGNCPNKPLEGTNFCAAHGGNKSLDSQEKARIRTYRLAKYQGRMDDFVNQPNIKSLRDEIGILRILMEERLNSLQNPLEILAHSATISDLCLKIEKLVTSCHKLEKSMGEYLDKNAIIQLAGEITGIINRYVSDADIVEKIATEIYDRIATAEVKDDAE